jgi:hypothetical protein
MHWGVYEPGDGAMTLAMVVQAGSLQEATLRARERGCPDTMTICPYHAPPVALAFVDGRQVEKKGG